MATPQEQAEFKRRQAERVKQAEQVVFEQEAKQRRCSGCRAIDEDGQLIKGRWYCQKCESSDAHIERAQRQSPSVFGGSQ